MRIGLGDIATVETLNLLIALERVKERGVDVEFTAFKDEDIAAQAVVNGQVDVGIGTPYALIQKVEAPIRIFYQLSTLKFYPVVDAGGVPGLAVARRPAVRLSRPRLRHRGDGQPARRAERHRVRRDQLRAGLGGARGRADAGQYQGDLPRHRQQEPGHGAGAGQVPRPADRRGQRQRRGALRPPRVAARRTRRRCRSCSRSCSGPGATSTRTRRWSRSSASSAVCCPTCRRISRGRSTPISSRRSARPCSRTTAAARQAARSDFGFYGKAGQLEGAADELQIEDFWYLEPLEKARAAVQG